MDYFALPLPRAGVLVAETTGSTDTVGTVWQDNVMLAQTTAVGAAELSAARPRAGGPGVLAVAGNGRQTGAYTVETRLLTGYLENPGVNSFQSGIGVLSGWVCAAETVEIEIGDLPVQVAGYGTERLDTAGCVATRTTALGCSSTGIGWRMGRIPSSPTWMGWN